MTSPEALSRGSRTLLLVLASLVLTAVTLPSLARLTHDQPPTVDLVRPPPTGGRAPGIVIVFVDSLRDETARDPDVMPALVALGQSSARFAVSPCRDQLTYLCLRAAFTGRDESELFALGDNFRHDATTADTTSIFAAAREQGRQVNLLGVADLAPYAGGERTKTIFFRSGAGLTTEDEETQAVRWFHEAHRPGQVTAVGLGRGDRTAHEKGANAADTRAAFRRIDLAIGQLAAAVGEDTLVVLGDHGHDAHGHHLPGTPTQTFALYRGRDFSPGTSGSLALTEHRVLLGLTLGTPTPAVLLPGSGASAALSQEARKALGPRLSALTSPRDAVASDRGRGAGSGARAALVVGLVAAVLLLGLARGLLGGLAPVWIALALLAGHGYDALRQQVHDHGYAPQRALWLLVPAALALTLSFRPYRSSPSAAYPLRAAATGAAVSLVALFPTAYFYGGVRASVLAVALSFGLLAVHYAQASHLRAGALSGLLAAMVASLYAVSGEAEGSRYVMTAACFAPTLGAVLPKLLLAGVAAHLVRRGRAPGAAALVAMLVVQALVYADSPRDRAALETIQSIVAVALTVLSAKRGHRPARAVLVACALLWMLVPAVGLRLSGIEFGFAFRIVPIARYEELWGVVAALVVAKAALPFCVLGLLTCNGGAEGQSDDLPLETLRLLATRSLLLLVFLAAYRATRPAGSRVVLEMLAEAVLVPFALLAFAAVPAAVAVARSSWPVLAGWRRPVR